MITLKKLTLENFLSHKKTFIAFDTKTQILLDGPSGSGKSSILDALVWTLFGVSRADNRFLVHKGQKTTTVTLDLLRDGEVISITRTATTSGKHTLAVSFISPTGERAAHPLSGIRPLQEWIEKELIGASYLLFINSIAYIQGNTESFVAQTASKRKELLLEIVKAEDYKVHYENARKTLSSLENDQNKASGQVMELEARLELLQTRVGGRGGHVQAITDNSTLVKDIEPIINDLEAKKASMSALLQTVNILSSVLNTALSDKETIETTLTTKLFKVSDKQRLVDMLKNLPSYVTSIEETNIKLTALRGTLATASENEAKRNAHYAKKPLVRNRERELGDYASRIEKILLEPVCPSGTECPYSGDHTKQVEDIRANIKVALSETEKENVALANWSIEEASLPPASDVRSTIKEIGEIESHLKNLESEMAQIKSVQKDIDILVSIEAEIPVIEKSLQEKKEQIIDAQKKKEEAEKAAQIDEVHTIDNDLLSAKTKMRGYQENITRATSGLESIDRDEEEARVTKDRISTIRDVELLTIQEKARKVRMIKEAFSSRGGIESMVLDILIPKLEDRINEFLSQMSEFRIRIDTQRKSADGESMVEGLYLFIANESGEEMDLANYSGGEKLRVGISVTEGLASLTKQVGFRIMDEAIFGLSPEMVQDFSIVLSKLQMNYPQILAISHLQEVKDLFDQQIKVVKHNGISTVA